MPPGKRRQSNAMLYTLITFVGLFIAATTVAVIYYVKAEELRTTTSDLQDEMASLASREEQRNIGAVVGTKLPGKSSLGTVVQHLDQMVMLVKGTPVQTTSAEVKVSNAMRAVEPLLNRARAFISLPTAAPAAVDPNAGTQNPADPNTTSVKVALTTVVNDLLAKLEQTTGQKNAAEKQLATLQRRFDDAVATMQETEQSLTTKVDSYYKQIQDIKTDYDNLKTLVQQNFGEREKTLLSQRETARADAKQTNQELAKTQAELNVAQGRLQGALATVSQIRPAPDQEAVAFKPDGDVILVDEAASTVRVNLGSEDRVYRGLTFSVYDRAGGIPRDGKPKAQVEILAVDRRASLARILSSDPKNPILTGDLVANLIWDSGKENRFVIAGEFDLDKDGTPDYDANRRIESLVRQWGGGVSATVTADTDYVILGTEPKVPPEPTLDQQTQDPTAMERYNAVRQMNEQYHQIRQRAEALWVPIFNYDRFLHFTGYASQIGRPGSF